MSVANMKKYIQLSLLFFACLTLTYLHLLFLADKVASQTNYVFSIGILPFIVGLILGCIYLLSFNYHKNKINFRLLMFPFLCGFIALLPVGYTLIVMLLN